MQTHCRLVTTGGPRFGSRHIKAALAAYKLSQIDTLIVDGNPTSETIALFKTTDGPKNIKYIPLPGLNFTERIDAVSGIIANYKTITLSAVDDLITDESIIETYTNGEFLTTQEENIVYGFGPDLTYLCHPNHQRMTLTVLPRYLLSCYQVLSQKKYWELLGKTVRGKQGKNRLHKLICDIGFFPFVYAVYKPLGLIEVVKSHKLGIKSAGIDNCSAKAGLLFEYWSVACALLCSPIHVSQKPFRLANYSPHSEGSRIGYNHQSIANSSEDEYENQLYFQASCRQFSNKYRTDIDWNILLKGWNMLGAISKELPSIHGLIDPQHKMFRKGYIKDSVFNFMSSGISRQSLDMMKAFLTHWPNV